MKDSLIYVAYGGGTNSKAMLIEMVKRGIKPWLIAFADTKAERQKTYADIGPFSDWLVAHGFPSITVVSETVSLEEDCLKRGTLPAVAFGFKTCSQRFKTQPQDKLIRNHPEAKAEWEAGRKIVKAIGFDWDEPQRAKPYEDDRYVSWYPLVEWKMGRDECVKSILDAGLELPGKSSCFFCPNMKAHEIRQLADEEPELADRAIALERAAKANLTTVPGLGRTFAWENVIDFHRRQLTFDLEAGEYDMPCECYDG